MALSKYMQHQENPIENHLQILIHFSICTSNIYTNTFGLRLSKSENLKRHIFLPLLHSCHDKIFDSAMRLVTEIIKNKSIVLF